MRHFGRKASTSLVVGLTLALLVPQAALGATVNVTMVGPYPNFAFEPATQRAKLGDTVVWTNADDSSSHTVTSDGCEGQPGTSGVGTFCSSGVPTNTTFSTQFNVAGVYPYFCRFHTYMQGTVSVNMKAMPSSGPTTTQFVITWAKGSIPAGFDVDVQIQRPGKGFNDWMTNLTASQVSATFTPDAGPGIYKFRSRLQRTATGGASDYSAAKKITVG